MSSSFDVELEYKKKEKALEGGSPLCCVCLNMRLASALLGLFYLVPVIAYYYHFDVLHALHKAMTYIVGIQMLFKVGTSLLCFYNAVSPQVWVCDYISILQTYMAYSLILCACPLFILALLQYCNWSYHDDIENYFDDKLRELQNETGDEIDVYLKNAIDKDETAASLLMMFGLLPLAFASFALGIAIDFNRMAQYVFAQEVVADYKQMMAYDKKLTACDDNEELITVRDTVTFGGPTMDSVN